MSKASLVTRKTPVVDNRATGEAMRQRRKKAGISMREVARRMEVSAMFICDLERGRRNWTEENATKFIAALKA